MTRNLMSPNCYPPSATSKTSRSGAPFPTDSQFLKKMNDLPLRTLCIDLEETNLDEAIQHCPAFKNITHLELITLKGSTWNDSKPLVKFTNLTHLCFDLLPETVKDEFVLDLL